MAEEEMGREVVGLACKDQFSFLLGLIKFSAQEKEFAQFELGFQIGVALHLTVVQLTCNENGDPDILLLARFHAQPGGVYHGSHDGILPQ
jgi:hypothetical protein